MQKKDILCKGYVYRMKVVEGKEEHVKSMTLACQETTGTAVMRAHTGEFPEWCYKLLFSEAREQLDSWFASCLPVYLAHGEELTLAYKHDYRRKENGEVIYEYAYDIHYEKGGVERYKFVYKKA